MISVERLRGIFGGGVTISDGGRRLRATRHVLFFSALSFASAVALLFAEPPAGDSVPPVVPQAVLLLVAAFTSQSAAFAADRLTGRWSYTERILGLPTRRDGGAIAELRFVRLRSSTRERDDTTRTSHRIEVQAGDRELMVIQYWTRRTPSEDCVREAETLAAFLGAPLRRSHEGPWSGLSEGPDERVAMPAPRAPRPFPFGALLGLLLVQLPLPYLVAPALLAAPLLIASRLGAPARAFAGHYEDALRFVAPLAAGLVMGGTRYLQLARLLEGNDPQSRFARKTVAVLLAIGFGFAVLHDLFLDPIDLDQGRWGRQPWTALAAMSTLAIIDFLVLMFQVPATMSRALAPRGPSGRRQ